MTVTPGESGPGSSSIHATWRVVRSSLARSVSSSTLVRSSECATAVAVALIRDNRALACFVASAAARSRSVRSPTMNAIMNRIANWTRIPIRVSSSWPKISGADSSNAHSVVGRAPRTPNLMPAYTTGARRIETDSR